MSCGTLAILKMTTHWVYGFSSWEFLRCLPLSLLRSPTPKGSVTELLANPTSFALFFRITETLADYDRKIPIQEKNPRSPPTAPVCRLRLIVSSTNSNEEKEAKKQGRTYISRGQPAYLRRDIRGEQVMQ